MESDICVLFTGLYVYILFLLPALSSGLRFYEILTPSDITVKMLNGSSITTVVFYFINQKYVLKLSPDGGILHPEAIAKVVDENNLETEVTIGRNKIFSGTVEHDLSRRVTAVEVNGTWIIHILSPDDLISIEPLLWYDRNGDLNTMVAFQGWEYFRLEESTLVKTVQCGGSEGDTMVESSSERLCMTFPKSQWGSKQDEHLTDQSKANARPLFEHTFGEPEDLAKQRETDVDLEVKPANLSYGHNKNQSRKTLNLKAQHQERTSLRSLVQELTSTKPYNRKRFRRSGTDGSEEATDCDVMVIVDYNLFRQLGADVQMTIATMIMVYKYSDELFRRTKFRNNPSCGIVLTEFRIHTDYSSQETHYNADGQDFIEGSMLLAILRNSTNSSQFYYFCLVHLNCKRNLRPSVVGLSYPAGTNQWSSGVCGVYYEGGVTPSPSNVLLSVDADDMGINLIEYALTVTHELGHAWGAHHKNFRQGCNDNTWNDIMNKKLLPNNAINTARFSACSVEAISKVLKIRRQKCFLSKASCLSVCGDGQVDPGEDCEPQHKNGRKDPCCGDHCLYKDNAECSFISDPCCTVQCVAAEAGRQCRIHQSLWSCHNGDAGVCTGNRSKSCSPLRPVVPDGSPCDGYQGLCQSGRCVYQCTTLGLAQDPSVALKNCLCPRGNECLLCCKDTASSECKVMASPRPDGFPCTHGTCMKGICKNASAAATDIRLYASFSKQDRTGKGEFQGSYGSRLNSQAFDLLIMLPLLMLLDQCS